MLSELCNIAHHSPGPASPIGESEKEVLIAHLRQTELRAFVEQSPAIFGPIQNTPYQTPSGELARIFLRVGNIQMRRAVLHALFFWLLPHLRNAEAILTDTWSISSIAYNVSRMLARYRGQHAEIPKVDMLSEYHTADETGLLLNLEVLRRFLRGPVAIGPGMEVIFLVSAVFTGGLLSKIKNTIASEGLRLSSIRFVALYRLQDTTSDTFLCDLSDLRANAIVREPRPEHPLPTVGETQPTSRTSSQEPSQGGAASTSERSPATKETPVERHQRPVDVLVARSGILGEGGTLPTTPRIVIDPTTYFPRLISEIEIRVRERAVREDKAVYDSYGAVGAFLVHRTQNDDRGPRHHGVYVDTLAFIESDFFKRRLDDYLRQLEKSPSLILGPDHPRAKRLMELVLAGIKDRFPAEIPMLNHPNLYVDPARSQPGDDAVLATFAQLDEASEILIVDDAFVTGTRLYQYSQHLRYLPGGGYRGRVRFLVAIARPPSITAWNEAQHLLRYRRPREDGEKLESNTVHAIEQIVLPNWDKTQCPWCIESGRLQDYEAIVATMPDLFRQRLHLLRHSNGLADDLFLWASHHPPLRLARDGVFIKDAPDQAAGFAAVAGGLQRLRTDLHQVPLGRHRYPLATVLNSTEYLSLVYTDSLLRASFFRAAEREELCYHDPIKETERAKLACDDICNPSGEIHNIALELCWQVLEGKLASELFDMVEPSRFHEIGISEEAQYMRDVLSGG